MRHPGILSLALSLLAVPAAAQGSFDLGEITVFANRVETAADATGASVTVIGPEELAAAGDVALAAFLTRFAGVTVTQAGPPGAPATTFLRGAAGAYVKVLVDGIDVSDPSGTQVIFNMGLLRTSDIARIEIVRGSQSALYGGSAVGGVIAITTRQAREDGVRHRFGIEAGSRESALLSWGMTARGERGELAVSASRFVTAGFSAADARNGNTEADGLRDWRLSASGRFRASDSVTLGFAAFADRSRGEYDEGFPLGDGSPDERADVDSIGVRGFAEADLGATRHVFGLSRYRIERRYRESNGFGPADNTYTGERTALDYVGNWQATARLRLVWGADWQEERYDQAGTFGPLSADVRSAGLWGQLIAEPTDRLSIAATLRQDYHSAFGGFTTGRLAAAFRASEAVTLRAAVSNGFRAPSPFELYSFYGDPALEPEESRSAEIGAEWRLAGGARLAATAFLLDTRNLIDYDFATDRYANIPGRTERRGIEVEAALPLGERATLSFAYTFTDTRTAAGGRLPRVPRHEGSVTLDGRITDRLSGQLAVIGAADVVEGGAPLGDFAVVNASLRYRIDERTEAYVRVENLFDTHYQRVRGYGTPGFGLFAGLSAEF
ncbi:MAG: TonB-dependent receptor [Rhodobacteraceae bacterium]|jgi:vitamin B12 transporter|nr:TonB-dependent receptor [Paracoccaceae bacterium]